MNLKWTSSKRGHIRKDCIHLHVSTIPYQNILNALFLHLLNINAIIKEMDREKRLQMQAWKKSVLRIIEFERFFSDYSASVLGFPFQPLQNATYLRFLFLYPMFALPFEKMCMDAFIEEKKYNW